MTIIRWTGFGWELTTLEELPKDKPVMIKIVDKGKIVYNLVPTKETNK